MHRPLRSVLACAAALAALAACAPAAYALDPLVAAAGDISCPPGSATDAFDCHQAGTANLIQSQNPAAVLALGDDQYESATTTEFNGTGAFNQTWGAFKPLIHPAPGNHEYNTSSTASGYFGYFGTAAGSGTNGWYSFDLGAWHIVSLNSNCGSSGCFNNLQGSITTAETQWLQNDLAANAGKCTLAYWHHPLFTSGNGAGNITPSPAVAPLWDALENAHADIVLNGHDHAYERFTQQDSSGNAATAGIREFVAGTGGDDLMLFGSHFLPNSQFHDDADFGALFLTLHPGSYDWAFRRQDGTVMDSGSTNCHYQPPSSTTGQASSVGQDHATVGGTVNPNSGSTTYHFDYGTSTSYGSKTADQSAGNGTSAQSVSANVTGLSPGTTYHFRLVASNPAGTTTGSDQTFATSSPNTYSGAVQATAGLAHYWRLGEASGATAHDSQGSANGTYTGGVTLGQPGAPQGDPDTAAGFDGTGRVSLPSLESASSFTIEGWTKLDSGAAGNYNGNNALYGGPGLRLIVRPSGFYAGVTIGGTEYATQGDTPTNVGAWAYWSLVRNGSTITVYRDGRMAGSRTGLPPDAGSVSGSIGAQGAGGYPLHGSIDEVAIYDAALSAATIQQHWSLAPGPYGRSVMGTSGITHYWRLGEPSGTVANDSYGSTDGSYNAGVTLGQPGALSNDSDTAASFGGSGWVSLPALGSGSTFTVEGWSKLASDASSSVNGNNALYGDGGSLRLIVRPSGVYAGIWVGGTEYVVQPNTAANIGGWVHWALVRNGSSMTVYRNGVLVASRSGLPTGAGTISGSIGAQGSGGYAMRGSVDEVAVYNSALSAATIQQHYSAASG